MLRAEQEFEAELEALMEVLERTDLEGEAEMFAPGIRGPIFDLACTGCGGARDCIACPDAHCSACPVASGGCRQMLLDAVVEGIQLARSAADLVAASIRVPTDRRDQDASRTAAIFTQVFCHDPSAYVSWAKGPSGNTVVIRLRAVANELDGGRRIRFVCREARAGCGATDATCCNTTSNAFTMPGQPSTVFLCPRFWVNQNLPGLPEVQRRAATIVHEMLHNLYGLDDSLRSGTTNPTPRRFDAHCYEVFLLQVHGFGVDPSDVTQCQGFACAARL